MNPSNSTNPFRRCPTNPPVTPDTNPFRRSNTADVSSLSPTRLPTRSQTTGTIGSSSTNPFRQAGADAALPAASASRQSSADGTERKEHWSDKDPVALVHYLYERFALPLEIESLVVYNSNMNGSRITAKEDFSKSRRYQGLMRLAKGFYDVEHGRYITGQEARACAESFCSWLTQVSTRSSALILNLPWRQCRLFCPDRPLSLGEAAKGLRLSRQA